MAVEGFLRTSEGSGASPQRKSTSCGCAALRRRALRPAARPAEPALLESSLRLGRGHGPAASTISWRGRRPARLGRHLRAARGLTASVRRAPGGVLRRVPFLFDDYQARCLSRPRPRFLTTPGHGSEARPTTPSSPCATARTARRRGLRAAPFPTSTSTAGSSSCGGGKSQEPPGPARAAHRQARRRAGGEPAADARQPLPTPRCSASTASGACIPARRPDVPSSGSGLGLGRSEGVSPPDAAQSAAPASRSAVCCAGIAKVRTRRTSSTSSPRHGARRSCLDGGLPDDHPAAAHRGEPVRFESLRKRWPGARWRDDRSSDRAGPAVRSSPTPDHR